MMIIKKTIYFYFSILVAAVFISYLYFFKGGNFFLTKKNKQPNKEICKVDIAENIYDNLFIQYLKKRKYEKALEVVEFTSIKFKQLNSLKIEYLNNKISSKN